MGRDTPFHISLVHRGLNELMLVAPAFAIETKLRHLDSNWEENSITTTLQVLSPFPQAKTWANKEYQFNLSAIRQYLLLPVRTPCHKQQNKRLRSQSTQQAHKESLQVCWFHVSINRKQYQTCHEIVDLNFFILVDKEERLSGLWWTLNVLWDTCKLVGPIKGDPWSAYSLMGKQVFGQKIELVIYKHIQDMTYTPRFS